MEKDNNFGTVFTFAIVVRGQLQDINELISFLKNSKLILAHQELGQQKMWIKRGETND